MARQPDAHASVRGVLNEVLSPKEVVKLQPIVEDALAKRILRWEECAVSGQASNRSSFFVTINTSSVGKS